MAPTEGPKVSAEERKGGHNVPPRDQIGHQPGRSNSRSSSSASLVRRVSRSPSAQMGSKALKSDKQYDKSNGVDKDELSKRHDEEQEKPVPRNEVASAAPAIAPISKISDRGVPIISNLESKISDREVIVMQSTSRLSSLKESLREEISDTHIRWKLLLAFCIMGILNTLINIYLHRQFRGVLIDKILRKNHSDTGEISSCGPVRDLWLEGAKEKAREKGFKTEGEGSGSVSFLAADVSLTPDDLYMCNVPPVTFRFFVLRCIHAFYDTTSIDDPADGSKWTFDNPAPKSTSNWTDDLRLAFPAIVAATYELANYTTSILIFLWVFYTFGGLFDGTGGSSVKVVAYDVGSDGARDSPLEVVGCETTEGGSSVRVVGNSRVGIGELNSERKEFLRVSDNNNTKTLRGASSTGLATFCSHSSQNKLSQNKLSPTSYKVSHTSERNRKLYRLVLFHLTIARFLFFDRLFMIWRACQSGVLFLFYARNFVPLMQQGNGWGSHYKLQKYRVLDDSLLDDDVQSEVQTSDSNTDGRKSEQAPSREDPTKVPRHLLYVRRYAILQEMAFCFVVTEGDKQRIAICALFVFLISIVLIILEMRVHNKKSAHEIRLQNQKTKSKHQPSNKNASVVPVAEDVKVDD